MKNRGRRESTNIIDLRQAAPTPRPERSHSRDEEARRQDHYEKGLETAPRTRPEPSRTPTPAEITNNVTRTIPRGYITEIKRKR